MKTNEIILMLDQEADKLWEALKNAELVYGQDYEATKLARARWVTAVDMLNKIANARGISLADMLNIVKFENKYI